MRPLALSACAALLAACVGDKPPPDPAARSEEVRTYLSALAPILVSRTLSADEIALIEQKVADEGQIAVARQVLSGWLGEPALADAARELIQTRLSVSGSGIDGVNYELPGNLAAWTVVNGAPWSTLVTADFCVGDDLSMIECDSGAPYTAGLLTTRAYLKARASRFNLTRASTLLNVFACQRYPVPQEVEPSIAKERLRAMFQANTPEEQEDPAAADAFGNGFGCYNCHSQFAWHAQLFVQFDQDGLFRPDATGLQDPEGELGRSVGGLFASHLADPAEAASPASQMLGVPVADLGEAGRVLGESQVMTECMARNILEYGAGLEPGAKIAAELISEIAAELSPGQATFADLVLAVFGNQRVYQTLVEGIRHPAPPADEAAPAPGDGEQGSEEQS
ncbi:MAG TPA: hypothetical protein VKZ63_10405 [Kofleriaceae bacterium]|nr:hypothetical protein [Kofleriaceae bacterium]